LSYSAAPYRLWANLVRLVLDVLPLDFLPSAQLGRLRRGSSMRRAIRIVTPVLSLLAVLFFTFGAAASAHEDIWRRQRGAGIDEPGQPEVAEATAKLVEREREQTSRQRRAAQTSEYPGKRERSAQRDEHHECDFDADEDESDEDEHDAEPDLAIRRGIGRRGLRASAGRVIELALRVPPSISCEPSGGVLHE